jgi:hypothetical protein
MNDAIGVMMFLFAALMLYFCINAVATLAEEYAYPIMGRLWRVAVWALVVLCAALGVCDVLIGVFLIIS